MLLDLIVRDKKGKPVTDLKPEDLTVSRQRRQADPDLLPAGERRRGDQPPAAPRPALDPLRQIRLVTLAFEAMTEARQRRLAREAALDLIKGDQGANVYYSVVVINTQLFVLQQFTTDKDALTKAIEHATGGPRRTRLASESDAILAELKRNVAGQNGADQPRQPALPPPARRPARRVSNGADALHAKLAR